MPCPALYKHSNHTFFKCPALFYHLHFSSDPRAAPGGMGAEQFDRRISDTLKTLEMEKVEIGVVTNKKQDCEVPSTCVFRRLFGNS